MKPTAEDRAKVFYCRAMDSGKQGAFLVPELARLYRIEDAAKEAIKYRHQLLMAVGLLESLMPKEPS